MEQLLRITNIPISLNFKVNNAKCEIDSSPASVEITRERGAFQAANNQPGIIRMDMVETRASMGFPTPQRAVQNIAAKGMQAAMNATATIVQEGNMMMNIQNGQNAIANIAFQRMQDNVSTELGFTPSVPVKMQYDAEKFEMQYESDKLIFDWRVNTRPEIDFTPANIEYSVNEYPRLEIEYIGGFIYAPPSSDPNYEEPQFNVTG